MVVVFPASMCAMIPTLRYLSRSVFLQLREHESIGCNSTYRQSRQLWSRCTQEPVVLALSAEGPAGPGKKPKGHRGHSSNSTMYQHAAPLPGPARHKLLPSAQGTQSSIHRGPKSTKEACEVAPSGHNSCVAASNPRTGAASSQKIPAARQRPKGSHHTAQQAKQRGLPPSQEQIRDKHLVVPNRWQGATQGGRMQARKAGTWRQQRRPS